MPNPPEPDNSEPTDDEASAPTEQPDGDETATAILAETPAEADAVTEVITTEATPTEPGPDGSPERRFTAPGFDAGHTEVIPSMGDAETEVIAQQGDETGKAIPQQIPARVGGKLPSTVSRSWGWVMAVILIIMALAVIAVLGTLWLTRDTRQAASQEEHVRTTIQNFDIAMQNGDLAALRSLTCGDIRDRYVNYDQKAWDDTHRRIAAAKQYPVVASIDEVVVNDGQAEANVTAFMAYEPRVRSTRSFDLQFRDDQWKICQSHGS
ncbi:MULTISPECIES: membrane protein [unclassified Mycobacterium]|uniref:Rv0361 family membrane protein n=1 Tax=unclassified Mycobacterium TaxID=2642494 RepID=UPI00061A9FB1|nr:MULTISPECIES: membrane protein [unclassified Mycobacterium]